MVNMTTQDEQTQFVLDVTARIARRIIDRVLIGDLPGATENDLLQQVVGEAIKEGVRHAQDRKENE